SGHPIQSVYRYDGGSFDMAISWDAGGGGSGNFTAPIVDFTVTFNEVNDIDVTAVYRLGPGLLDATLADFLHVRRETRGGVVNDSFLFAYAGDLNSPSRAA